MTTGVLIWLVVLSVCVAIAGFIAVCAVAGTVDEDKFNKFKDEQAADMSGMQGAIKMSDGTLSGRIDGLHETLREECSRLAKTAEEADMHLGERFNLLAQQVKELHEEVADLDEEVADLVILRNAIAKAFGVLAVTDPASTDAAAETMSERIKEQEDQISELQGKLNKYRETDEKQFHDAQCWRRHMHEQPLPEYNEEQEPISPAEAAGALGHDG
jgi:hypothetical protein